MCVDKTNCQACITRKRCMDCIVRKNLAVDPVVRGRGDGPDHVGGVLRFIGTCMTAEDLPLNKLVK